MINTQFVCVTRQQIMNIVSVQNEKHLDCPAPRQYVPAPIRGDESMMCLIF